MWTEVALSGSFKGVSLQGGVLGNLKRVKERVGTQGLALRSCYHPEAMKGQWWEE